MNLLVTGTFAYVQLLTSMITWDMANDARSKEAQGLCAQANKSIDEGRLQAAGDLVKQAEMVQKKLTHPNGWGYWKADVSSVKLRLVQAYLKLQTPKYEEAKKWADSIERGSTKFSAIRALVHHLINTGGESDQIEALLAEGENCELYDRFYFTKESILNLRFEYAFKYNKPAIIESLKGAVKGLKLESRSVDIVLHLITQGKNLNQPEVVKLCIEYIEQNLDKVTATKYWVPFESGMDSSREGRSSAVFLFLIGSAIAIKDMDLAERLLTSDALKGEDRFTAHIHLAKAYSKPAADKAKEHLVQAVKLIEEHTFPADMEEREIKREAYRLEHYGRVFNVQLGFDLEGAYQTAKGLGSNQFLLTVANVASAPDEAEKASESELDIARKALGDLDAQFDKLSNNQRLRTLDTWLGINPNTVFEMFEKHRTEVWDKESNYVRARALICLAKAHLEVKQLEQARQVMVNIQECHTGETNKAYQDRIAASLVYLQKQAQELEPKKRFYIF